jgi:hypothetical protein
VQPNEITEVLNRPISQELLARDVTRLAYVARDGTPRNVLIAFTWNGSEIVMCTSKNAPKLAALRENPMVVLSRPAAPGCGAASPGRRSARATGVGSRGRP